MCQSRWYSIGTIFRYNKQITAFDEFQYFGITDSIYQGFDQCTALRKVTLPSTMKAVGSLAFRSCSTLRAILPDTITSIGAKTFEGLSASLTIYATTPPTLGSNNFTLNCTIYVPSESVDAYKSAWSDHASKIQAIL